jgi:hypothetical protein
MDNPEKIAFKNRLKRWALDLVGQRIVMAGAYVRAEGVDMFIVAGLGRQVVDGRLVFFLSPQAPLAKMLQNKKVGDSVVLNGRTYSILEVF